MPLAEAAVAIDGTLGRISTAALVVPLTLPLPSPLPPVHLQTVLVGIHILGVSFGLGGATMLDFWILRWLRWGSLPDEVARIFGFVSKVCTIGITLLWISGLGFLALYSIGSPEKLANPKLWAKITVVVALSINGLVIHYLILPGVLRDVSQPIFRGLSNVKAGIFLVSGVFSGISWYMAFAFGLMRELNGTVSYGLLIGLWLLFVGVAVLGGWMLRLVPIGGATGRWRPPSVESSLGELDPQGPHTSSSSVMRTWP